MLPILVKMVELAIIISMERIMNVFVTENREEKAVNLSLSEVFIPYKIDTNILDRCDL